MLIKILGVVAALVAILCVVAAMQPAQFVVTRSAMIGAPAPAVFAQVNNLHNWENWSPWAKLDPACKMTYEGPTEGSGAAFAWDGNNKVGAGRMAILESRAAELVRLKLDFLKPFKASNNAEFTFKPDGNATRVTWSMSGTKNFMFKVMGLFMNCDKMVGSDFEKGLAQLKAVSEVAAKK